VNDSYFTVSNRNQMNVVGHEAIGEYFNIKFFAVFRSQVKYASRYLLAKKISSRRLPR